MTTGNPSSTGVHYPEIFSDRSTKGRQPQSNDGLKQHDANMSGPGASHHHTSNYAEWLTRLHSGFFHPDLQPYMSPQQRQEYEQNRQQLLSLQQQLYFKVLEHPPPNEQSRSSQIEESPHDDEMEIDRLSSDWQNEDMSENSFANGGQDSAEGAKQSAPIMAAEPPQVVHGGPAPANSTATCHGGNEQGLSSNRSYGGASNHEGYSASLPIHGCCNTPCSTGRFSTQGSFPPSQPPKKKSSMHAIGNFVRKTIGVGGGDTDDLHEGHSLSAEKFQNDTYFDGFRKEKEELRRRFDTDMEKKDREMREAMEKKDREMREAMEKKDRDMRAAMKKKDEALIQVKDSDKTRIENLLAELEDTKASNAGAEKNLEVQITSLTTKMTDYKSMADRLTEQLSSLEQLNSKSAGGTGAHKDSHAIPPNLVKSVFVVNEAAFAFTKTFITFLKERMVFENYVALQSVPVEADSRYRKYAVEAYICSRMFAGFENDGYVDSLDCLQGSQYLLANYEERDFFLQNQNLESRHQQYLSEYDEFQKLGSQGFMENLKTNKISRSDAFYRFCCRKLVSIVGVDWLKKEFPNDGDSSNRFLLFQLARHTKYSVVLKSFVNLAMVAFLLHRLAFQFNPPARIFRYARGTSFDPTYMETAVPIDDDDSNQELTVGLMLVPGFQVGATIIKCTVYLVPRSVTPGSDDVS